MHVKVNYPDAVMQIREIKCSVKAGDIIGEKLENHIQELDDNITVKESRKSGIERRERILNIQNCRDCKMVYLDYVYGKDSSEKTAEYAWGWIQPGSEHTAENSIRYVAVETL